MNPMSAADRFLSDIRLMRVDYKDVLKCVCEHYKVTLTELRSPNRSNYVATTRQIAMYLLRKLTQRSYMDVGLFVGRKDHSTVLHGVTKIDSMAKANPRFAAELANLEKKILG